MRRRDTVYKALCGVGILALVVPLILHATAITQGIVYHPSGGSGPPQGYWFRWGWNVSNLTSSQSIHASANMGTGHQARWMRVRWWILPDEEVVVSPPEIRNQYLPPFSAWADARQFEDGGPMYSGNNYYWKWDTWYVNTMYPDGTSIDVGALYAGRGGDFQCK
jgi:hypothetical protein